MASVENNDRIVTEDDVWDDTELIRAYDKAVKQWKRTKVEVQMASPTPGPGPWIPVDMSQQNVSEMSDSFSTITFTDATKDSNLSNATTSEKGNDTNFRKSHTCENSDLSSFMPHFPVPPMPASLACPDGTFNYEKGELPALLLSWYMSGYQAGYFDAKSEIRRAPKQN